MFEVFTEEIEVMIKDGIANLYWYKNDLRKAWLRCGVDPGTCDQLFQSRDSEDRPCTKRQLMDLLYENLRTADYNKRLEISRNFVRILVEHRNFVPQDQKHRIEVAERCALKLREEIASQEKQREYREQIQRKAAQAARDTYQSQLMEVREQFTHAMTLEPQKRGYELEKIFPALMKASGIPVEEPFKITGEQIDGAIKYDGHFYLMELRWVSRKCNQADIAGLYLKAEGKMEARGIFLAMEGYSREVVESLPRGKDIKVLLLDGVHFTNVIYGMYSFQELLEHALNYASLRGDIYCPATIS